MYLWISPLDFSTQFASWDYLLFSSQSSSCNVMRTLNRFWKFSSVSCDKSYLDWLEWQRIIALWSGHKAHLFKSHGNPVFGFLSQEQRNKGCSFPSHKCQTDWILQFNSNGLICNVNIPQVNRRWILWMWAFFFYIVINILEGSWQKVYQGLLKRYFKLETLITMTIWPLEMIFKPIIMNKCNNWTLFLKETFFSSNGPNTP